MIPMPRKTFAAVAALVLAMVMVTLPLGAVVQASSPMHGWMMHDDGGSARFEPNELPDPFERDLDGDCVWWQYELKHGRYVRTHTPCRYGDAEVDYRRNVRAMWNQLVSVRLESAAPVSTAGEMAMPASTAGAMVAPQTAPESMELPPSTAGEIPEASKGMMEEAELPPSTMGMPPADAGAESEEESSEETGSEETEAEAVTTEAMPSVEATENLVDTAADAKDFVILLDAASATGLADTLSSEGPFTLFAPNDAAFAALPEGSVDELMADPSGELTNIVKYHVVPGIVMSADFVDGQQLVTLSGDTITITVDGDTIMVDGASILYPDIESTNGVIHVIDTVLQPVTE